MRLQSAKVQAEIVEHFKGEKQLVFKFKRRKGYKRLKGHRQEQTRIKVTGIDAAEAKKTAKKPAKKVKAEKSPNRRPRRSRPRSRGRQEGRGCGQEGRDQDRVRSEEGGGKVEAEVKKVEAKAEAKKAKAEGRELQRAEEGGSQG